MEATLDPHALQMQGKVTFHEPNTGWSAEQYAHELEAYVMARGRAPQSVTMHPETAAALGLREGHAETTAAGSVPFVVTSRDYDRHSITLYY